MANINKTLKGDGGVIGSRHPRLDFERMDSELAAVLKKVVDDTMSAPRDEHGRKQSRTPSDELLQLVSQQTTSNINEANSMMELLPDIELARQILVSSILSPNDLTKVDLHFSIDDGGFSKEFTNAMLDVIDEHFDKVYKIKKILPSILSEALFEKGSYPLLILPENTIDDAINSPYRVSMESISSELENDGKPKPLGILGSIKKNPNKQDSISLESLMNVSPNQVSTENYNKDLCFRVTDNPSVLKLPMLIDKLTQDRIQDTYSVRNVGMEAKREKLSEQDLETSLYRKRRYKYVPVLPMNVIEDPDNPAVGHPLVMKLPPESVIPVHVPSNPEEHVGFFVLLDTMGNPISKALESDYYSQLQHNIRNNNGLASQLLDRSMQSTFGRDERAAPRQVEEMVRSYTDMVEGNLISSLKNGVYGDSVEVSRPTEVYRIMLARAAAQMQTQLLYIPIELMTYFAFDYNSFGVGKSLLESSKMLGSIRAVLMFANTMAAVKNSVGHTDVRIQLDPQDPDPNRTVEFLLHEYTRTSKAGYPLGESNPADIIDYLQKAAINLQVSGNPAYPETTMDVGSRSADKISVDTELEQNMKDRHIMSMGLSPETVDLSTGADFATSVVASNLLLSKRVMMYQEILTQLLEDFVRKYTLNSGTLMDELREIVEGNKKHLEKEEKQMPVDSVIMNFLNAVNVTLPSPDSSTLESQMMAFRTYNEALEMALDAYFSSEWMDMSTMDELSDSVDSTRAALRSHFQRQWMRNNNMLPELGALTTFDEKDGPALNLMEVHENHIEAISKTLEEYMRKVKDMHAEREKREAKHEEEKARKEEEEERKRLEEEGGGEEEDVEGDEPLEGEEDSVGEADEETGGTEEPESGEDEAGSGDDDDEEGTSDLDDIQIDDIDIDIE